MCSSDLIKLSGVFITAVIVEVRRVHIKDHFVEMDGISFSVQEGEFVGIMGASGSGKTTLLNCISTIDTVSAGLIYLDGTDVAEINEKQIARFRRENLGFVFQDFNLLDTLTISENIALALTINKVPVSYTHLMGIDFADGTCPHLLETKAADEKTSGYGEAALREIPYF